MLCTAHGLPASALAHDVVATCCQPNPTSMRFTVLHQPSSFLVLCAESLDHSCELCRAEGRLWGGWGAAGGDWPGQQ